MFNPAGKSVELMLLGMRGVGKTSLLNGLMIEPSQRVNLPVEPTRDFESLLLSMSQENQRVQLKIWDTPGLEHSTDSYQGFFKTPTLFLLCFDANHQRSLFNLATIIQDIQREHHNPSFLFVGTKMDDSLSSPYILTDAEVREFADNVGIFNPRLCFTSAIVDIGINKLSNMIFDAVTKPDSPLMMSYKQKSDRNSPNKESNSSQSYFFATQKKSTDLSLASIMAASLLTTIICIGIMSLNPVAFGVVLGVLTCLVIGFAIYAGFNEQSSSEKPELSISLRNSSLAIEL